MLRLVLISLFMIAASGCAGGGVAGGGGFVCAQPQGITASFKAPITGLSLPSSRVVRVALSVKPVVPQASSFTLASSDDPSYRSATPAVKFGTDTRAIGFDAYAQPVKETRLHLLFPRPMRDGATYTLDLSAIGASRPTFRYRECRLSDSVQAVQTGYDPAADKYAYAGNWLGTAGPMPVDTDLAYLLDAASGKPVWAGALVLRAAADPWSGNDVYSLDFSAWKAAGNYRVYVPGLGVSYSFAIDPYAYHNAYLKTMRLFYHIRNSTAISAPYAEPGYERTGGVPAAMDGVFHPAIADPGYPLNSGETPYAYHPVTRGWFDAGDYGQYIPNAALVWFHVALAMDLAPPGTFTDGELNIPESGNGIPDVLDELAWGMDWALTMQDIDGGVYFRIASETWDNTMPDAITTPRYIYEKTTHATACFAAMAAIFSRLIQPYDPGRAQYVLTAAENAWNFLMSKPQWPAEGTLYVNPPGTHAGEFADPYAADNILWAAAELYRTTGKVAYRDYYQAHVAAIPMDNTAMPSFQNFEMAARWAYLKAAPVVDSYAQQAITDIVQGADWRRRMMQQHPFRAAVHYNIPYLGWGDFGQSARWALQLLQGYHLTGDPSYLAAARIAAYPQLGANPLAMSFITGLGHATPKDPLSKLSLYDGVQEPLPGIPVFGPMYHLPASIPANGLVNAAYDPPEQPVVAGDFSTAYPVLRRYVDSHMVPPTSEYTIAEASAVALAFGVLSGIF